VSGRGLCDELITRPEESYRLWCVVVCDLETSWMRRSWPSGGSCAKIKQTIPSVGDGMFVWNCCTHLPRRHQQFLYKKIAQASEMRHIESAEHPK